MESTALKEPKEPTAPKAPKEPKVKKEPKAKKSDGMKQSKLTFSKKVSLKISLGVD